MAIVLIIYGTTEGHTALIAGRIAEVIRAEGHEVELHDSKEFRQQLVSGQFDGIIVGGSVHAGDYQASLRECVKRNRGELDRVPSAFFSVSLSAADPDEDSAIETMTNLNKFFSETGWQPRRVETIGGALVYTQYNIFIRHLMKLIAKSHGRTELDTSRDFDFTNWDAVAGFAREFADVLRRGLRGPTPPRAT